MANYDSYMICTTPRSGSTLLCKLLAATGQSGNPDSWFHTPSSENWVRYYLNKSPESFATPTEALSKIFHAVRNQGTNGTGIFGLRLQQKSLDYFMQQLSILHPEIPRGHERFQAVFGKTLFIYLSRRDRLEQAISYVKATQTGLWHIAPDGSELERLSAPQEPVYSAEDITDSLREANDGNQAWEQWFERENIKPLRVEYEALAKDPAGILRQIFDESGIDLHPEHRVTPGVAKLADASSQQWKTRYLSEVGNE